uniref:Uncharacterized protein n=1 Tax=viral metagenome TaxID=1070528 RepID=A0A6M3IRE3_9ZZZZ
MDPDHLSTANITADQKALGALAAALQSKEIAAWFRLIINGAGAMRDYERLAPGVAGDFAAAIIAALDGWTLVPSEVMEGHRICEENMDAEIARLREALKRQRDRHTDCNLGDHSPWCLDARIALAPPEALG